MNGNYYNDNIALLKDIDQKLEKIVHNTSTNLVNAFLIGVVGGFGAFIGATLMIALLIAVLQHFITVPVIGQYIKEIIQVVQNK
jgi:mannitol-specific phosphotransferase system IIBC component